MGQYILAYKFNSYRNGIALMGCGGTGGFVAEGLARLLKGYEGIRLLLIDGDRVEKRNLGRQNFYPEDLGRFKSQALAERLSRRYGRPVGYSVAPLSDQADILGPCALVVGCVDNHLARAAITQRVSPAQWWVDAGNGAEHGQILVGNWKRAERVSCFEQEQELCHALPLPTWVRPELLVPAPRPRGSCAGAVAAGEQGPTINQFMAALVVEVVRRLLEGRLGWWQAFLDLEVGSLHTVRPSPEAVSKLTGVRLRELVKQPERR